MKRINWEVRREDYALQVVPELYRTWSWISLVGILFGVTTAMVFLSVGGSWVQLYGTKNLIFAMAVATVVIGTIAFILSATAAEVGLDMDLITSGSGMGYKGAGFTSLIYAAAFVIYFALEGSIIADAVHTLLPNIPIELLYFVVGFIFVPITWYGLTIMNVVMWVTLPICIALLVWSVVLAAHIPMQVAFWSYQPSQPINHAAGPTLFQLLAIVPTFVANATAAADIARFIPKSKKRIGAISLGYILNGVCFLGAVLLGAWMSLRLKQTDPGVYFPSLLGFWGVLLVLITQIRINTINIYTGSLAFATFFSRTMNLTPGRHWWVMLTAVLGIILMSVHILDHITSILTFGAIFMISWVMAVISYIIFNRYVFKLSPSNFPVQKGAIANYNPIGLTALFITLIVSVPMSLDLLGPFYKTLASFVAASLAFIIVPLVTLFLVKIKKINNY